MFVVYCAQQPFAYDRSICDKRSILKNIEQQDAKFPQHNKRVLSLNYAQYICLILNKHFDTSFQHNKETDIWCVSLEMLDSLMLTVYSHNIKEKGH